jgi:bla regulator protein BlaR1
VTALLDHLWQSTLFALSLGALALLLRRHAASLRFWLWFGASVKFLVPFSVLMAIGAALTLPVAPMLPNVPALEMLQDTAAPFTNAPAASVVPDGDHELAHAACRDVGGGDVSGAPALGQALA